jgi:hypothetical protein
MISFKEYLAEAVAITSRQNMIHLQKMDDADFIDFAKRLKRETNGVIRDVKVSLKVDGGGGRVGRDAAGRPFFEGSRTGPIFDPKAFSTFAKNKGATGEVLIRSQHYDDMFDLVTQSAWIKTLPADCKVVCELFYNPMGKLEDDGITFVTVKYDKSKLGSLMTIIPFKALVASTGEPHPDSKKIIANLLGQSTAEVKFVDPGLSVKGDIEIAAMIDPVAGLSDDVKQILKSRLKADAEEKRTIKALLQVAKNAIAEYILDHPAIVNKDLLGPNIEGLVLNISGQDFKVTTTEFKASKAK